MIETPVSICFVIPQRLYAKFVVFYIVCSCSLKVNMVACR